MRIAYLISLALFFSVSAGAMPSDILLIRHGEKPDSGDELSPRGWERAKALPALFDREPYRAFGRPAALFAMGAKAKAGPESPAGQQSSVRAIQTLKFVSESFGLPIEDRYLKGDEKRLVKAIRTNRALDGKFIVICWEHKKLTDIAAAIGVNPAPLYPDDRYDRAWLVTMDGARVVSVRDLPENLLPGDSQE